MLLTPLLTLLLGLVCFCSFVSNKPVLFDADTYREEWWKYQPNPDELSGKLEGDMILAEEDFHFIRGPGYKDRNRTWPEGVIYYNIGDDFTSSQNSVILAAMEEVSRQTCLRFQPRTSEEDYVDIQKLDGCWASIGRQGGMQPASLGTSCLVTGIVMHNLLHVAGFMHENNRNDRNEYVRVIWDNIQNNHSRHFERYSKKYADNLGISYDYGSLMHFSRFAFTKYSLQPTLEPREKDVVIGQRKKLSEKDVLKINKYYNCRSVTTPIPYKLCTNVADGILLSHPMLANKFYQCFQGKDFEFTCPAELLFNPKLSVCDWPFNVQP